MIWYVEDDAGIREIVIYTLKSTLFEAEGFEDGAAFFEALKTRRPELLLLDVMLPGMDGVEILRKMKSSPDTADIPVIMATAKGQEYDKVKSLDLGADDYLVKPFGMMEMVSRIRAVLRRSGAAAENHNIKIGGLEIDQNRHIVKFNGARVELTFKEYELLKLLMTREGMVFTRDQLLSTVWNTDFAGETRTVDVHVQTLRTKLGSAGAMIKTVRGVGYKLEGNI